MSENLMYTPLETIFRSTMEREGRTMTAYTSGKQFRTFMRRNRDGNNYEDRITLFYSTSAPMEQGSLVSCGNKIYLLINKETQENDCYYRSRGLVCNGTITLNNGNAIGIPCYASSIRSASGQHNSVMSVIGGNIEFITESNALTKKIEIGDTFNEFGRTFKVNNIYDKNGILHIVADVTINEKPYEKLQIFINGVNSSYSVGETVKLEASLYVNAALTIGTVIWKSSNNSIATIDKEGNATFLSNGYVVFTAYWAEKKYTRKIEVRVAEKTIPTTEYKVEIEGKDRMIVGYSRTYTVHLYDSDEREAEGIWDFEISSRFPELIKTTVTQNKIEIDTENNNNLFGEELILTATESRTGTEARKVIELEALQ